MTQLRPSLLRRASNLVRDTAKHVASGRQLVDDDTREFRRQQCLACPLFDHQRETCSHPQCGCGMNKQRGIFDALGWASKKCPVGRWENPPLYQRPAGLARSTAPTEVLLVYRQPPKSTSIGLGVNASLSAVALRAAGVAADSSAVETIGWLRRLVESLPSLRLCVVEGFYLDPDDLLFLARDFPRVLFVARCHSQVAFLQIEPGSVCRMRDVLTHSRSQANLRLAGNSPRLTQWASQAWCGDVLLLPNLYPLDTLPPRPPRTADDPLRLASFGAMRLQKHHAVAAAAAAIVARRLGRPVEFLINAGREEMGSDTPRRAIHELIGKLPGLTLREIGWQPAPAFRASLATLDLGLQLSASETFNLVTADLAAAGVPSVVGEAIDWAPLDWRAPVDDPLAAADVALRLLADDSECLAGRAALERYAASAIASWLNLIQRGPNPPPSSPVPAASPASSSP